MSEKEKNKQLIILGSTGSIGVQALDVARLQGYDVLALTADRNVERMEEQIRQFRPRLAALANEQAAADLKARVADTATRVLAGGEGVKACAALGGDATVLNSIVGMAGLEPTLAAIEAGSRIALANKETLVAGGKLVFEKARANGVDILPVDSEHSAIFQALQGMNEKKELKRLILTASGGPFFGKTKDELKSVTLAQALKHPNWSMGAKITVDSATMMNKGLELIEARWLFNVDPQDIEVVIHPQSIIHSMVQFSDGCVMAQLSQPDMRLPIQYALAYPLRLPLPYERLDFIKYSNLTFEKPDRNVFPCLDMAYRASAAGGGMPCVMNAANEKAVRLFMDGKIKFTDIPRIIEQALASAPSVKPNNIEDYIALDEETKSRVQG